MTRTEGVAGETREKVLDALKSIDTNGAMIDQMMMRLGQMEVQKAMTISNIQAVSVRAEGSAKVLDGIIERIFGKKVSPRDLSFDDKKEKGIIYITYTDPEETKEEGVTDKQSAKI